MRSEPSRTFIGSVVCVDLVGYSKRTVDEQGAIKEAFNRLLSRVIGGVRPDDRIILDTGDGAAVTFLGDPDECLKVGLEMRDAFMEAAESLGASGSEGPVRIGMNLGPLRVALDMNGHPNIIGDGLNTAERVMSFAQPGQIVASRSFHEMVSRLSAENGAMFRFEGKHTDKNEREHEIYIVEDRRRVRRAAAAKTAARKAQDAAAQTMPQAPAPTAPRPVEPSPPPKAAPVETRASKPVVAVTAPAAAQAPKATPPPNSAAKAPASPSPRPDASGLAGFLRDPVKVWSAGAVLLALIFGEAWMLDRKMSSAASTAPPVANVVLAPTAAPKIESAPPAAAKADAPPMKLDVAPAKAETPPAKPETSLPKAEAPKSESPAPKAEASPAKTEPARTKPEPPPQKAETRAPPVEPRKQEALPPAVPVKTERAKELEPAPGSPMAAAHAAREKADAARTPSSPTRRFEEPRVAAARPSAPASAAQPEPTPAPPAAARPAPEPAKAAPAPALVATATPITRVPVNFPRAAAQQGIEAGVVKARLAIDADGKVTGVTLLGSSPPRVFDREAVRALEEWRFNPGAPQRSYEVEIEFKR